MVFSGVIQPAYRELVKDMDLERDIGERIKLSIDEYERLHRKEIDHNSAVTKSRQEFVLVGLGGKTADKAGFREYDYIS
jgi:hydroxymethylglutaryl-CoA synthase